MSDSERNLDAVQDTIFAILNEQMQWEQNSYDWKVGVQAVSHARGAVTGLFESELPANEDELIEQILQVLGKVQDLQQANEGRVQQRCQYGWLDHLEGSATPSRARLDTACLASLLEAWGRSASDCRATHALTHPRDEVLVLV